MRDKNFSNLDEIAKKREVMLDDVIKSMSDIEVKKNENANQLQKYKVDIIKYKTTIKELNEYIEIYKQKLDNLEKNNDKDDKELINLRKKLLIQETDISTLKSILDLFVQEFGIDRVVELTKLEKSKIESYLK
ncbi:MAG: hypothetical protein IJ715_01100 [Bacilli bacterium]|nr:hypothetical protein [Bacilli bacterium]